MSLEAPHLERVEGFGLYNFSVSEVHRPASVAELRDVLGRLRARGQPPVFRGAGRSYGDAAINAHGPVVDLSGLGRIRSLDEETGVVRAEAGVTIGDLWRVSLPRGFWPPVVTGTMHVTLGGALAVNVHGKNGWREGTLADHVLEVSVLRRNGELERIARDDPEFSGLVGNFRAEEPIVEVALKLKNVATGYLDVEAFTTSDLRATLRALDEAKDSWAYVVAWTDCFARGASFGRSVVHVASGHARRNGEGSGLTEAEQLADVKTGPLPVPLMLLGLRLTAKGPQMRAVNAAKYFAAKLAGRTRARQSLVAYSFLLDYLPGWNEAYRPGGFIQYQLFVPKERAEEALGRAIRLQHEHGTVSSLAVLKRHRADTSPHAYTLDGFSLALDFPVTRRGSGRLLRLCRAYDRLLLEVGGRVYRAKDCVGSFERLAAARGTTGPGTIAP
ncbi:MAG: FAD-dependent oxidoreductase [Thermoanaerobaculia bacterium]